MPDTRSITHGIRSIGMDRTALRRANASTSAISNALPPHSVQDLAREVISRMAGKTPAPDLGQKAINDLSRALVSDDDSRALALVNELLAGGEPIERVYLSYLAGAAAHLGRMWSKDEMRAAEMSIAAARIYAIMRGLSAKLLPDQWPDGRHVVFASVPGEQHTLGVSMAADLFRRDGWLVDLKVDRTHDELMHELAVTDYALLGLSASTQASLEALIRVIAAVRVSTPHVQILVCGGLVRQCKDLPRLTGADALPLDFPAAKASLEAMSHRAQRRGRLPQ